MNYAFQDRENLYLAMDLLAGGDLRFHINRVKIFSEEQASLFLKKYMPFHSFLRIFYCLCFDCIGIFALKWNFAQRY